MAEIWQVEKRYFNTSNVEVLGPYLSCYRLALPYFNTSNVEVLDL